MRQRAQSATGDYTFGQSAANFLVDSAACVGQSVKTRLRMEKGEWYLDVEEGTPWSTEILGENTKPLYDQALQERILNTPGVTGITEYESIFDGVPRSLTVIATINTEFGPEEVELPL